MKKCLLAVLGLSLLSGCAMIPSLQNGAESVKVTYNKPPQNCKEVIDITSQQDGRALGGIKLQQGAMNQLRNAAYAKGANLVYVTDNYSNPYRNGYDPYSIESVVIKGMAYNCPDANNLSDIDPDGRIKNDYGLTNTTTTDSNNTH